jgi:hypothetical protein
MSLLGAGGGLEPGTVHGAIVQGTWYCQIQLVTNTLGDCWTIINHQLPADCMRRDVIHYGEIVRWGRSNIIVRVDNWVTNVSSPVIETCWGTTKTNVWFEQYYGDKDYRYPVRFHALGASVGGQRDLEAYNHMALSGTLPVGSLSVTGNVFGVARTQLASGIPSATNVTLQANAGEVFIGTSNVNLVAIMGGAAGTVSYVTAVITNGTGFNWGIGFSAVTNKWRWAYDQPAPTVLTNGTQLVIQARVEGTNVHAWRSYYVWP